MNPFQEVFDKQKAYFETDVTKTYEWRIDQLNRMEKMLRENEQEFHKAIGNDFKTSFAEQVFETQAPLGTIEFTKSQLAGWMRSVPAPVPKFLAETGHTAEVYREPYGVTLVMGPFNGPLILLLHPAINAISGGNPVILKLNNSIPATSEMLLRLIPKYFEAESVAAVTADIAATTELLKLPFDFIFFTGSTAVGKVIMRAAAENLTPVLLELGGQNPTIVDETADIADAAKKIVWGATAWGGQWCASPGYACVHESVAEQFAAEAKKAVEAMYGNDPKTHPDLSRIINGKKVKQLASLLKASNVLAGGQTDEDARYVAPTVVYPVQWTDPIMEEELFGPILPILTYKNIDEVVKKIKSLPRPLAAYVFSSDEKRIRHLLQTLHFGGGAVNQVNIHIYIESMPFGGVGSSGMGHYYGKYGFDALTHAKSILYAPPGQEIEHLIPPYTLEKIQALKNWFDY
jgi:aldehyde dehydrogenase (NAD+)